MRDYAIIQTRMVKEDGNFVNRTEMPSGQEYDGQYLGVGYPKVHNLYRGAWNPKRQQMVWTFVMLVDL